jgi:hypothetical protein
MWVYCGMICLVSCNSHPVNIVYCDSQRVAVTTSDHFGEGDTTGHCSSSVAHLIVNGLVVKNTLVLNLLVGKPR